MALTTTITNANLWDAIRARYPQFKAHTASGTMTQFTEAGFEALQAGQYPEVLNEWFMLSMRVYLQMVNVSRAADTLESAGFGEYFDNPYGGYIQRMSIDSVKPVSPAYKGLSNGDSVDPFVVRKGSTDERIFRQNFDYQSLITIPDDFQMKQIFISPFGMSEFMGGLMTSLQNGYIVQVYNNKLEALNAGLNSTKYPLQDTQKMGVSLSPTPTVDELADFILAVNNVVSAMMLGPQSSAYNAMKFNTVQDKSRLKLLIRPGYTNDIRVKVLAAAFNREDLNIPVDIIEVPHFGGLQPFKEAAFTTPLYPVYDKIGVQIGFTSTSGGTSVEVENDKVFWKDPNANIVAILVDKGYVFNSRQNEYQVTPIYNPRGMYTNFWANSPNNTVCVDPLFNMVAFVNTYTPGGAG